MGGRMCVHPLLAAYLFGGNYAKIWLAVSLPSGTANAAYS
ncbi:hypothetical protein SOHN41_03024 [Shewanella sp. HN-41]|nr:hypothetical protein SOHN41_03024 [Shewanella sp. HN-41]